MAFRGTVKLTGDTEQLWKTWDRKAQKDGARGTVYYPSGEEYQGEWHNNLRHGKGALTYTNGDKYEGDWQCGLRHGLGSLWLNQGGKYKLRYTGHWANDQPEGQGRYVEDNGDTYDGEWLNGLRHGRGKATYGGRPVDGFGADVFEGCWEQNMRHGPGTLSYGNGDVYEGSWAQDKKHGPGTYFHMSRGRRFDGIWHNDKATCGSYSEIELAAPGAAGALPNVELAQPDVVLQQAIQDLAAAAQQQQQQHDALPFTIVEASASVAQLEVPQGTGSVGQVMRSQRSSFSAQSAAQQQVQVQTPQGHPHGSSLVQRSSLVMGSVVHAS